MGALRTAGERLGRYALAKRQAVQQEDFITATLRKEQIEMYRNAVYQELQVDQLMERDSVRIVTGGVSFILKLLPFIFRSSLKMMPFQKFTHKNLIYRLHQAFKKLPLHYLKIRFH